MAKKAKTPQVYRTYQFKDHDPILDRFRSALTESEMSYGEIHNISGVSIGTLGNWKRGKTKRPQYCTVIASFRAMGIDLKEIPFSLRNNKK